MEAPPTPSPPINRAHTKKVSVLGMAEPMALIVKRTAHRIMILFRPKRSLSAPANIAPKIQPTSALDAAHPFRPADRLK